MEYGEEDVGVGLVAECERLRLSDMAGKMGHVDELIGIVCKVVCCLLAEHMQLNVDE